MPYLVKLRRQLRNTGQYPPGHYYSPIPARVEIHTALQRNRPIPTLYDIDLRRDDQFQLLKALAAFYKDLPFSDSKSVENRYYFDQVWFCYTDAIMLYCLIRQFGIRRVIEIGSGYSSAVMLDTMEQFGDPDFELTFIEPHPERLNSLIDINSCKNVTLLKCKIQDVRANLFDGLQSGDMLFIDSSHIVKFDSDLHSIIFDILPRLPVGVIVHFHDIFYPFEYPADWLLEGKYWNEAYFLRALLSGNHNWKILLFNDYVNREFSEFIKEMMPLCRKNFGASLYIQKVV